jgi:hypothetical protein
VGGIAQMTVQARPSTSCRTCCMTTHQPGTPNSGAGNDGEPAVQKDQEKGMQVAQGGADRAASSKVWSH